MAAALDDLVLGEHADVVSLATSAEQHRAAVALVRQARRSLDIFSRDLDRKLYDQRDFLDALQALAMNRGQVRILVKDSTPAVRNGHRLIALSQRLTSLIEIRRVAEDYREYNQAFLVADATGYAMRRHADRFEGSVHFNAAKTCRELLTFFDEVWRNSAPDPDLQRLYL